MKYIKIVEKKVCHTPLQKRTTKRSLSCVFISAHGKEYRSSCKLIPTHGSTSRHHGLPVPWPHLQAPKAPLPPNPPPGPTRPHPSTSPICTTRCARPLDDDLIFTRARQDAPAPSLSLALSRVPRQIPNCAPSLLRPDSMSAAAARAPVSRGP
jgi:hypothetical protein